jgi:D-amino-acid oxidase
LAEDLRSKGATFIRKRVSSLDEAYNIPEIGEVNVVVNATGLGSQTLLGIEDKECYPARGQTVLVKAPGVKTCYMMTEDLISASKGCTYRWQTDGTDTRSQHSQATNIHHPSTWL